MHAPQMPSPALKVNPDFAMVRNLACRQCAPLLKAWLPDGKAEGDEWVALNPTRPDNSRGSFKVNMRTCEWADFATGDKGGDLIALCAYLHGLNQHDAMRRVAEEVGLASAPPSSINMSGSPVRLLPSPANLRTRKDGLTLEAYAAAKKLPADFLRGLGVETQPDPWGRSAPGGEPRSVLAIPYRRRDGSLHRYRLRVSMEKGADGAPRLVWDKREEKIGARLYGLDRLPAHGSTVLLVEGESDAHTLWLHGFDAVAAPGSGNYSPSRDDAELEGFDVVAIVEPDKGGEALVRQLMKSKHRGRVRVSRLSGYKDASDVHLRFADEPLMKVNHEEFAKVIREAIAKATPLPLPPSSPTSTERSEGSFTNEASRGEEATAGDRRPTLADVLVRVAREAATFFNAPDDTAYAAVEVKGHQGSRTSRSQGSPENRPHREVWPLRSRAFRSWIIHRFFAQHGRAPSPDVIAQAQLTLEALAAFEGVKLPVFTRTASCEGKLYVDLGDDAWRAIEIDHDGWRVVERPPVMFKRSNGSQALPEPVRGGNIEELKGLLNVATEDDFKLIVAWLLAAFRPRGPYPLLALAGEPGTSKTSTATVLRSLVDPHVAGIRRPPREERDLYITASKTAVLAYDNLSSIPEWLSDGLCVVATGGTYSARAMRTNDEEALFTVERPVMITSVGEVIARSDLADRAMLVTLAAIPDNERIAKAAFEARLEAIRPRLLGVLFDALSVGLREVDKVSLGTLPRMADFITWVTACEVGLGWERGSVYAAFKRNVQEAVEGVLEGDAVAVALRAWFSARSQEAWTGRTEQLLGELNNWAEIEAKRDRSWPRNPQALRSRLTMAAPSLRKVGIVIDRRKSDGKRLLVVHLG